MTESTDTGTVEAPRTPGLPWQIRAARIAEGLFLPVGVFSLAAIPLNEIVPLAAVGAQVAVATAAFVGLKRRRRWAWVAAMVLAAFFITRIVSSAPTLAHAAAETGTSLVVPVALTGWAFLTQLAVLLCCLTLLPGRRWRTELR